ncbi:DUF2752 domain-containing protein [Proteinivorax hydrogeniformans]|uniref:DUF2752 domain-containing protein n=1 Tax=Proteinivorax hydrogeniformans TaxID=1826727 RepID=A0AAU8HUH9_9FIRM
MTCLIREITGIYCPGCGTIRALTQMIQGNFLAAMSHNVLAVLFTPLLLWYIASSIALVLSGKSLPQFSLSSKGVWVLLIVVVLFGVARNIPLSQFDLIRP